MDTNNQPSYWIRPDNYSAADASVARIGDTVDEYQLLNELCDMVRCGKTGEHRFQQLNDQIYVALLETYPSSEEPGLTTLLPKAA